LLYLGGIKLNSRKIIAKNTGPSVFEMIEPGAPGQYPSAPPYYEEIYPKLPPSTDQTYPDPPLAWGSYTFDPLPVYRQEPTAPPMPTTIDIESARKDSDLLLVQLESYEKALEGASPEKTIELYFLKGLTLCHLNRFSEAIGSFMSTIALKPNFIKALFNLAVVYEKTRDYSKAIEIYEQLLSLPDIKTNLQKKARVLNSLAVSQKARALEYQSVDSDEKSSLLKSARNNFHAAKMIFLSARPESKLQLAKIRFNMAVVYKAQERYSSAEREYDKAIEGLSPGYELEEKGILIAVYNGYSQMCRDLSADYQSRSSLCCTGRNARRAYEYSEKANTLSAGASALIQQQTMLY
jgi:tetratricopeptide (TPR) repeat protein